MFGGKEKIHETRRKVFVPSEFNKREEYFLNNSLTYFGFSYNTSKDPVYTGIK